MKYYFTNRFLRDTANPADGGGDPNAEPNNPPALPDPNNPPADPPAPDPNAPADPPPADPAAEEDPVEAFWNAVTAEHGIEAEELQTIFNGLEDTMSTEAVVAYGNTLMQRTQQAVQLAMKEEDPRAYSYWLHRRNGGTDEEFLSAKSVVLPELSELDTGISLQKSFYKRTLEKSGLEPEQADILVEDALKKAILKDKAVAALNKAKQEELTEMQQIEATNRAADEALNRSNHVINNKIKTVIEKGDGLKITIPAANRPVFTEFLNSKMVHDGKNFFFELPVDPDSADFKDILQGLYLVFNKSDISKMLVKRDPAAAGKARLGLPKVTPPKVTPPAEGAGEGEFTIAGMLRKGSKKSA